MERMLTLIHSRARKAYAHNWIGILALLLTFSACSPAPAPTALAPTPSSTPSPAAATPTALPSLTPTGAPSPSPAPDSLPAPRYTLSADLDGSTHTLRVMEKIDYTNRTGQPLPDLLLVADALVYPGSLDLTDLKSSSGPALQDTVWDKTHLKVTLQVPLEPGATLSLEAAYQMQLPARSADPSLRPMVFGWSEHQTNLVDWYLYVPPYLPGQGWVAHSPGYYGEHQAYDLSDFLVNLRVTNGPPGLIAAASAPEQTDGDWRRYELKQARTFAISLSPLYQVETLTTGEVSVRGYFFSYHAAAGRAALKTAADSLVLYGRLFGPYPHPSLAVVEADFLDGMEYDGLFFLSNGFYNLYHGTPGEYLVALSAHETAHQWWYGLVGSDQALEPWLDEALSTYSEHIYYENLAPAALDWWWQVRVKYYNPRGFIDDSIYNPHQEVQAYRAYRDAVYLNGALFLDDLRAKVGDEIFLAFLKDYAERFRGRLATTDGFFSVLREHTQLDLAALVKKYFAVSH